MAAFQYISYFYLIAALDWPIDVPKHRRRFILPLMGLLPLETSNVSVPCCSEWRISVKRHGASFWCI